mgnify:CR=1 FL=1
MTCPHRSALATLLLLAVVLVEAACRGVRAPEPDEVAEARRLLDAAALTLPLARLACPATPRPDLCAASLRAAAATVEATRPLLAPCPAADPADPTDRYLCEQERVEAVRRALPEGFATVTGSITALFEDASLINKALADFAARGWIRLEPRSVTILDPARVELRLALRLCRRQPQCQANRQQQTHS